MEVIKAQTEEIKVCLRLVGYFQYWQLANVIDLNAASKDLAVQTNLTQICRSWESLHRNEAKYDKDHQLFFYQFFDKVCIKDKMLFLTSTLNQHVYYFL